MWTEFQYFSGIWKNIEYLLVSPSTIVWRKLSTSLYDYEPPKIWNRLKHQFEQFFIFMDPTSIYLFKVSNGNTRTMCEICSKLTIKTPERVTVSIVDFEQVNASRRIPILLSVSSVVVIEVYVKSIGMTWSHVNILKVYFWLETQVFIN